MARRWWRSGSFSSSRFDWRFSRSWIWSAEMFRSVVRGKTYPLKDELENVPINVSSPSIILHEGQELL